MRQQKGKKKNHREMIQEKQRRMVEFPDIREDSYCTRTKNFFFIRAILFESKALLLFSVCGTPFYFLSFFKRILDYQIIRLGIQTRMYMQITHTSQFHYERAKKRRHGLERLRDIGGRTPMTQLDI